MSKWVDVTDVYGINITFDKEKVLMYSLNQYSELEVRFVGGALIYLMCSSEHFKGLLEDK